MHRALPVLLALVLALPAAARWEQQDFVILLGWPFEIECPSDEALAQAMKAAGFNVVMWDMHKLDLCQKYGLKVSLYHGDVDLPAGADFSGMSPDWQRTYSGLVNSTPGDYLMVTNRRIDQPRWAVLQLARPIASVEKLDKHTGQWTALPLEDYRGAACVELVLPPGDGDLLRVS